MSTQNMQRLTFVAVNGARLFGCTTLPNAAQLVAAINRAFEGRPAKLEAFDDDGPGVNPKHAVAFEVLDELGLTRLGDAAVAA